MKRSVCCVSLLLGLLLGSAQSSLAQDASTPSEPAAAADQVLVDPLQLFDINPMALTTFESQPFEIAPEPTLRSVLRIGTVEVGGERTTDKCQPFDGGKALIALEEVFQREGLSRFYSAGQNNIVLVYTMPMPADGTPTNLYELRIAPQGCVGSRCRYDLSASYLLVPKENGRLLLSQRQRRPDTISVRLYRTLEAIVRETCARPSLLRPLNAAMAAFQ